MKKRFKKIYIEITKNCNLTCSFCSKTNKTKKFMTLAEFSQIIPKVKEETDYIYLHVKGEPLLHPELIAFLDLAEENYLKVNITTNGTLFPHLANKLKDCKAINKINFSLHCENNLSTYFADIFNNVSLLPKNITIIIGYEL